jgi:hypothetical protein
MRFGVYIHLKTNESARATQDRLAAVVVPAPSALSFKPVRVSDWLRQFRGRTFVGDITASRFKLALLPPQGGRFRARGMAAVMVGTIEDGTVLAHIRPPLFNLFFSAVFTLVVTAAFVLSFYGPSNGPAVRLMLAALLVLPLSALAWSFFREARRVEKALRSALSSTSRSTATSSDA